MLLKVKEKLNFKKNKRLLSSNQFFLIRKKGKRFNGDFILFQVLFTKKIPPKVGITVSKKFGCSVKRNLFKRLVREVFRLQYPKFVFFSFFVNVMPKKDVKMNFPCIYKDFENFTEFLTLNYNSKEHASPKAFSHPTLDIIK